MKSKGVGLIVCAISFKDFQPMWSWSTNVTDGRTDRRMTCNRKTALCTVVHRAVKRVKEGLSRCQYIESRSRNVWRRNKPLTTTSKQGF